jgi:NTP pyrophosphatase (non-canonical NTP hydrolase)
MNLNTLQTEVDQWIRTIGIRYYSELTNTAILMEEVGEVARLMARLYGDQSFKTPQLELTAREDLADEMADVLWVLVCLANQTGVDLTEAIQKNIEKKTKRDAARHAGNKKLRTDFE